MTEIGSTSRYALGSTEAEHGRLIRQAAWLTIHTERLFREAGIGPGQRVLDLGSGVGDVSLIAARLVGPSGQVVGIERDPRSIVRATTRMAEAGLRNVSFTQSDAAQIPRDKPFDAAVGRYILMFLPDPGAVLRSLSQLVRSGGVLAFQEPCWKSFLVQSALTLVVCRCFSVGRDVSALRYKHRDGPRSFAGFSGGRLAGPIHANRHPVWCRAMDARLPSQSASANDAVQSCPGAAR
jgi:SAM-dependent methyltransferase